MYIYILFDLQENIYNVFNNHKEWQKGLFHNKKDVYYDEYTLFFQNNND